MQKALNNDISQCQFWLDSRQTFFQSELISILTHYATVNKEKKNGEELNSTMW